MKSAAALVVLLLVGCRMTATRSLTCDRAAAVILICTLSRCDVPPVEANVKANCEKPADGRIVPDGAHAAPNEG